MLWGDKILPRGWIGLRRHWPASKREEELRWWLKCPRHCLGGTVAVSGVGVGVRPLAHWHKFHHPSTHLSAVPPQPWTDGTTQPHLAQEREKGGRCQSGSHLDDQLLLDLRWLPPRPHPHRFSSELPVFSGSFSPKLQRVITF